MAYQTLWIVAYASHFRYDPLFLFWTQGQMSHGAVDFLRRLVERNAFAELANVK